MSLSIARVHPPSLSTISDTTVNSSVVARQKNENLFFSEDYEGNFFENVYEHENKAVRVGQLGDVNHIYNFYTPPNNEG